MIDKTNLPRHIAIIMDGNGRWAKERGRTRTAGHREGIERVREIVRAAGELGIEAMTFFAFSTENWSRPRAEVSFLMRYLDSFIEKEIAKLHKNNIRFRFIGRENPVPKALIAKIRKAEKLTVANTGTTVVLALNYGSRQEIVEGAKRFAEDVKSGKLSIEELDPERLGSYLYTAGLPDPDLLIRTSGEMRISNFLLWQLSYAELYFPKVYWPDFRRKDFEEAIEEYQKRERRFGGIDAG
jgi:undecaprenyl diphosphate synthase